MAPSPESQLSYLGFQLIAPGSLLRPYIRSYWQIHPDSSLETRHEEFMHPTGGYGIVFNLGERVQLDGRPVNETVFLDGANHGYYDQSHFIREFSAVVGMTPYAYLRRKQKE